MPFCKTLDSRIAQNRSQKEGEIDMGEIERTPVKVAVLNVAAVILSIAAAIFTNLVLVWFFGALLKIPFLVSLLSFPSTPELYVVSGIDFGIIGASYEVCDAIAPQTKSGRKPAISVIGLFLLICFSFSAYTIISTEGFRDVFIVNALAAILSASVMATGLKKDSFDK